MTVDTAAVFSPVGTIVANIARNLRFALNSVDCGAPLAVLNGDLFGDDDDDLESSKAAAGCKMEWESRFSATLSDVAAELAYLDSVPCCLTFSAEDAARSWHGRDGQPMPLWTAPSSAMAMTDSGAALAIKYTQGHQLAPRSRFCVTIALSARFCLGRWKSVRTDIEALARIGGKPKSESTKDILRN